MESAMDKRIFYKYFPFPMKAGLKLSSHILLFVNSSPCLPTRFVVNDRWPAVSFKQTKRKREWYRWTQWHVKQMTFKKTGEKLQGKVVVGKQIVPSSHWLLCDVPTTVILCGVLPNPGPIGDLDNTEDWCTDEKVIFWNGRKSRFDHVRDC